MREDLIQDYRSNGKRTLSTMEYLLTHLSAVFGMDRAIDLTTDRINGYVANRQKEGASNATVNRELAALKRMFSLANKAEKLTARPYIPTLEENNARQGFLDHGSFLLMKTNLAEYLRDPVQFLYLSGWRVSEMRALEWSDVDVEGKVIRLRPEISKNKDGRVLPLMGELFDIIERAQRQQHPGTTRVFHRAGKPIGDFRKAWNTACSRAGISGMIVHDLRRTAVRNMVRAGIPEKAAMNLSGHKTRDVFDRYTIVSENDLAQYSVRLQTHLQRQPKKTNVSRLSDVRGRKAV